MSNYRILFQLSGSIACFKACNLISMLVKNNFEVVCSTTPNALKFIGISTLEGLSGRNVYHEMFESGPKKALEHTELSKWYDLCVLCPATANVINKMAAGIADDAVTTSFLAHDFKTPYLIAPAMNKNMYDHPTTKRSIMTLKQMGVTVLDTDFGRQACGDVGNGRLLPPEDIFEIIASKLNTGPGEK